MLILLKLYIEDDPLKALAGKGSSQRQSYTKMQVHFSPLASPDFPPIDLTTNASYNINYMVTVTDSL